jgi:hypothetical protein
MITFEGTDYYTQQEVADYLHGTKATIANKISQSGVQGVRFGRMKYYTKEQVQIIRDTNTYAKK